MPSLRASEWITLVAFSGFTALACGRRTLSRSRRAKIIILGLSAIAITLFVSSVLPRFVTERAASINRDASLFMGVRLSFGGQQDAGDGGVDQCNQKARQQSARPKPGEVGATRRRHRADTAELNAD